MYDDSALACAIDYIYLYARAHLEQLNYVNNEIEIYICLYKLGLWALEMRYVLLQNIIAYICAVNDPMKHVEALGCCGTVGEHLSGNKCVRS